MIVGFDRRCELPRLRRALRPWPALLVLALLLPTTAASAAPRAARGRGASSYPAAATRATFRPAPSDFARSAPAVRARASAHVSARSSKPKKPRKPVLHGNPARALLAFQAMQNTYYIDGSGLYEGEPFSFLWPFSQALAATITMSNVEHVGLSFNHELHAQLVGLNSYLDTNNSGASEGTYTSTLAAFDGTVAPPVGPGGTKYYDDNDWVGIELVRLYELTRKRPILGSAEGIMAFEIAGWQTSPELGCPGGLPFDNQAENTDRNTVTTAPAAELALQLYRLTGKPEYLQFAEMAYEWVRHCLQEPSGLYGDHLNPQGVIEPMVWSYNQGTMIGAGTMLYQATGNPAYLAQARHTSDAALAYFTTARLNTENPFFPSVYFRNLLYLGSVIHSNGALAAAQAYVNYAWLHLRTRENIFVAAATGTGQLLVQSAIVQIYALLSSPPASYF
jgi:glycosyl hydrolase family 76